MLLFLQCHNFCNKNFVQDIGLITLKVHLKRIKRCKQIEISGENHELPVGMYKSEIV